MFPPLHDLAKARILVSNDDGIDATGLKVLEEVAKRLSPDVWVVAPETEQSGAGHSLTIHRPLRLREVSERRYAVDGTPTDCVLLAINHIFRGDRRPDLLLSGVNRGSNLGEDVTYSGTVAAAMEGCLLGVRSFAFSQEFTNGSPVKWSTAEHHIEPIVRRASAVGWDGNVLVNVNFPDVIHQSVIGVEVTSQGKRKLGDHLEERLDPRGRPYIWIGMQRDEDRYRPGTDLDAVSRGAVSVTPLSLDMTHHSGMAALREVL